MDPRTDAPPQAGRRMAPRNGGPPLSDLARLAEPFGPEMVEHDPAGHAFVAHPNVDQRLLEVVGPSSWERVAIVHGDVPAVPPNPRGKTTKAKEGWAALENVIVGAVWRLTVEIDGREVRVEEAGDVEHPHLCAHDGRRLKEATSDARKRCAMRAGAGLHLWAGDRYALWRLLEARELAAAGNGARG